MTMSCLQQILRNKEMRRARLASALNSIKQQLIDLGAVRIILFGSFAKGEVDVGSDLDLLVIMPSAKTGKEWSQEIYREVQRNVAADILVFNEQEFQENLPVNRVLRWVVQGQILYEKGE